MRFRPRHVHQTVIDAVTAELTARGWVNTPVNFGTAPITVVDYQPIEAGEQIADNTVAISIGDETATDPFELGAGLRETSWPVFVDIYAVSESLGLSVADDVKAYLTDREMALLDYTANVNGTPTTDWLEFEHVMVEKLTSNSNIDKRTWRSVKATVTCYHQQ